MTLARIPDLNGLSNKRDAIILRQILTGGTATLTAAQLAATNAALAAGTLKLPVGSTYAVDGVVYTLRGLGTSASLVEGGGNQILVSGTPGAGKTLTASYPMGVGTVKWQNYNGTVWTDIAGETAMTHVQTGADALGVRPISTSYAPFGAAVTFTPPAPYLGNFVTAIAMPDTTNGSNKMFLARTRHIVRATLVAKSVQVRFPNFTLPNNVGAVETPNLNATPTLSACIIVGGTASAGGGTGAITGGGTPIPLTWGGSSTVVPDAAGMTPLSDPTPAISASPGSTIWVQVSWTSAVGILYIAGTTGTEAADNTNGEQLRFAASGLDLTQVNSAAAWTGGTYQGGLIYRPACVVAMITETCVGDIGDSISRGQNSSADPGGDKGIISRSVGPTYAYINLGQTNSEAAQFLVPSSVTNRMILLGYCSHIILKLGINDFQHNAGTTSAQVAGYLAQIIALFPGKPVFPCTLTPHTTGACTLADGSDQTVSAVTGVRRSELNPLIRAGIPGAAGYFDLAAGASLGGAANDSKWYANGTTNYMSADLLHPGTNGETRVKTQGSVVLAALAR